MADPNPTTPAAGTGGAPEPLNLDSYYYSFDETGCRLVDELLAAVADAGNRSHHTESWSERDSRDAGPSPAGAIQEAATRLAAKLAAARAEVEKARNDALEEAARIALSTLGLTDVRTRIADAIRAARTTGGTDAGRT